MPTRVTIVSALLAAVMVGCPAEPAPVPELCSWGYSRVHATPRDALDVIVVVDATLTVGERAWLADSVVELTRALRAGVWTPGALPHAPTGAVRVGLAGRLAGATPSCDEQASWLPVCGDGAWFDFAAGGSIDEEAELERMRCSLELETVACPALAAVDAFASAAHLALALRRSSTVTLAILITRAETCPEYTDAWSAPVCVAPGADFEHARARAADLADGRAWFHRCLPPVPRGPDGSIRCELLVRRQPPYEPRDCMAPGRTWLGDAEYEEVGVTSICVLDQLVGADASIDSPTPGWFYDDASPHQQAVCDPGMASITLTSAAGPEAGTELILVCSSDPQLDRSLCDEITLAL